MPVEFVFREDSMLKTIESIQKTLKSNDFDQVSDKGKREIYASLFACRSAANAERNNKKTLKVPATSKTFQSRRDELVLSPTFQSFLEQKGHAEMMRMLSAGHGGEAEDAFQKYVMEYDRLPADVPDRYMPTAEERIEQQQNKLTGLDPRSDRAVEIYAEIFRCRRAVNAVRKKGNTLKVKIKGQKYADTEDLAKNKVFRDYIKQYGGALRSEAQTGHGGAAEDMFKDHLLKSDHIPAGAPKDYMPTAQERLEMLQTRIKTGGTGDEQRLRYTEIMATRDSVKAIRGDKKSLTPQIPPAELDKAYETWSKCETFQNFLKAKPEEALAAATAGHGGKLGDKFSEHVLNLDHIPADVPDAYMPQADERLEVLKEKYKAADYNRKSPEEKLALAAEVMATREVVQAVRGDKSSLTKPVDPVKLNEAVSRWTSCKAFKEFVADQPAQVREGGSAGHGGLMGDKFKEYVLNRDMVDGDVPVDFMPTAAARLEVLQKKIRDAEDPSPEKKQQLYAELMATRGAVEAVRSKAKSLNKPVDPVILAQEREKLTKSAAFQSFIQDDTLSAEVRTAALDGHGGALEDKFKEYVTNLNVLPDDLPARYMPTALERTEALQKKIKAEGFPEEENAADVYLELMAARDAVDAKRSKADTLKVPIDAARLKEAKDKWSKCETFRAFVEDPDSGAREAALAGHGGALEDKFKEYIKDMDVLPEDVPEEMLPTALERNEALQAKLKTMNPLFSEPDEYASLYAQMLASRASVGAERGKKATLEKQLDPKNVNRIAKELTQSSAFHAFLRDNKDVARHLAGEGHGGKLEEGFKIYVKTMVRMPQDLPAEYIPNADVRIEGLQEQFKSDKFKGANLDTKVTMYAELLGARKAVGAVRKDANSLKHTLPAEDTKKAADALIKSTAFREFIEKNPDAAKKAALSGHGGALEDAFKDYVKNMDKIPADVPKEFMPTALERTEVLQKKIKSGAFRNKNLHEQNLIYKELVATRAAVESVRGDKKSLNQTIDAKKLGEIRGEIYAQGTADTFFDEANRKVLYDAATSGHGGALDDKLKEDALRQAVAEGVLPPTPERFRPTAAQLREGIKQNLASELKVPGNPIFGTEKETVMRKVAGAMYLTKLKKNAQDRGEPEPVLNPKEMKQNVDALMKSKAFQNMFDGINAARNIAELVKDGRMSSVMEILDNNKHILDEQRQRQLQQQAQYQQEVQQELNNQQRNRANSLNNRNRPANRQNQNQNLNQNQDQQDQNQNQNLNQNQNQQDQNQNEIRRNRANSMRQNRENQAFVPGLR